MRRWLFTLTLVAACGRIGFEQTSGNITPNGDASESADAMVLTGMGCGQPPPFIWISSLDVTQFFVTAQWCSAGLSGEVTATLMSGAVARNSLIVDVAVGTVTLGATSCGACFVRLEIGGYRYDSETFDLIGD